jgi:hypothetical protein
VNISDVALGVLLIGGLSCFVYGIVLSNIAVYQMAKVWNQNHGADERIPPWAALGKGANTYEIVPKYRNLTGDGPLYKQLRTAYWMLGGGIASAAIGFGIGYLLVGHSK